ncbi:MAG TPA: hypothetical protein VFO38_02510 [Candidatus Saccharimonadales bacterium]|nr:hypothetical protein [Candidatus Saccharimonadales bacterium]
MARNILFLDLDRTLLDTDLFVEEFWHAAAKLYNFDPIHQIAQLASWYKPVGNFGYYSVEDHVRAALGKTAAEVGEAVRPLIQHIDFTYPDTAEIKDWQARGDYELRILTFGERWLQTYKLSLTPTLSALPCDIILVAKGDFIAKNFTDAQGFLIDDKRGNRLPPNFKEIWINRRTDMKIPETITIHSLAEVKGVL